MSTHQTTAHKIEKLNLRELQRLETGVIPAPDPAFLKRVYTAQQITEITSTAHAEGFKAGELAALKIAEAECVGTVNEIVTQFESLLTQMDQQIAILRTQSAQLAMTFSKCLAPALLEREPYTEIEALFNSCIASLITEPRIVIRVNDSLVEQLKHRIDAASQKAAYQGRIVILGDPDAATAYCRIEWADGGVVFDAPSLLAEFEQRIAKYLDVSRTPASSKLTQGINQ